MTAFRYETNPYRRQLHRPTDRSRSLVDRTNGSTSTTNVFIGVNRLPASATITSTSGPRGTGN